MGVRFRVRSPDRRAVAAILTSRSERVRAPVRGKWRDPLSPGPSRHWRMGSGTFRSNHPRRRARHVVPSIWLHRAAPADRFSAGRLRQEFAHHDQQRVPAGRGHAPAGRAHDGAGQRRFSTATSAAPDLEVGGCGGGGLDDGVRRWPSPGRSLAPWFDAGGVRRLSTGSLTTVRVAVTSRGVGSIETVTDTRAWRRRVDRHPRHLDPRGHADHQRRASRTLARAGSRHASHRPRPHLRAVRRAHGTTSCRLEPW